MNIDFDHHAGFSTYVLLLIFSGVVMLGMGSPAVKAQSGLLRALNLIFGLGFVGYGFYLAFLFQGGTYVIFFKAFFVPIVMIIRTIRTARLRSVQPPAMAQVPQQFPQQFAPGQPPQPQYPGQYPPQVQYPPQSQPPRVQYPPAQYPPQVQYPPQSQPPRVQYPPVQYPPQVQYPPASDGRGVNQPPGPQESSSDR